MSPSIQRVRRLSLRPVRTTDVSAAGSIISTDRDGRRTVYNQGDIAWILASMALIWIMIPGVGFFYSGLLRRKNSLSMIYLSIMAVTVVSFQVRSFFLFYLEESWASDRVLQWFFWGYSLVFSETTNGFIGDLRESCDRLKRSQRDLTDTQGYFGLKGVLEKPSIASPAIPSILFCAYQSMFAAFT